MCRQSNINTQNRTNEGAVNVKGSENSTSNGENILPTPFSLPLIKHQYLNNSLGLFKIVMEDTEFSLKEIDCSIHPLRLYVEDTFIAALLDFAIENLNIIYVSDTIERSSCDKGQVLIPKFIAEQILSFLSEPLRLQRICIKPLSILLSVHTCMR